MRRLLYEVIPVVTTIFSCYVHYDFKGISPLVSINFSLHNLLEIDKMIFNREDDGPNFLFLNRVRKKYIAKVVCAFCSIRYLHKIGHEIGRSSDLTFMHFYLLLQIIGSSTVFLYRNNSVQFLIISCCVFGALDVCYKMHENCRFHFNFPDDRDRHCVWTI